MNKKYNYDNLDTSVLFALGMITHKNNERMILSRQSAARFWGFSPLLNDKFTITVPKGYNTKSNKEYFDFNFKTTNRCFKNVIDYEFDDRVFKITSPERTIAELIKEYDGKYDDQKIETINNFFKEFKYNREELLNISKDLKVDHLILAFEAVCAR